MQTGFLSSIEFQMSLILFVAFAGYIIASRINQSAVVGIILGGVIIGPSFLNLITYPGFVSNLAHLGAVILLFTVGLHFKLRDILNSKYFLIALVGIIIPWIGGYYIAKLFGFTFGGALIVGTALTATSIAITANVLKEMGKLQTETAKAIIGAAIIDDVLGLLVLSISQGVIKGALTSSLILISISKAAGFLVLGALLGQFIISRIIVKIDNSRMANKYPEFIFIFAMMAAFFYSMTAEFIGLSAIVGSFLAGVCLCGTDLKHSKSFKEGAEYLNIIFASVFFVSLGILVDLHEVTLHLVFFIILLTIVAVLTKVIGCGLPARLQGMSKKDSLIIGFGMSPRGEVAMIVALIGLTQKLILQEVYVAIVLMSLLTTILTPIVLKNWLFEKKMVIKI